MTCISRFLTLAVPALLVSAPVVASEAIMPQTLPVALDPADAGNITLGELTYLGGLEIDPGEDEVGGLTGLEWHDGQLYSVSKDNHWLIITPDEILGQLADLIEIETGELLDERGKRLRNDAGAASSLTMLPAGDWSVGFDADPRHIAYDALDGDALPQAGEPATSLPASLNGQFGNAKGSDCAESGVCFYLFGDSSASPSQTRIVAVGPEGLFETVAIWEPPLASDNFSGLAVRENADRTFLYVVSDNDFSDDQRTVVMKFEVDERAATAPGVPPKVYETVDVVIETAMGEITVRLETERAPITAGNFLRYVKEDRYDDTRCYRAMRVKGGEQPAGFLQCGTQNRPDRVLPGIPHEPTTETGLSHTDGALSMARFEPGTATGDFSIMIRDQRGLDAYPDADDPAMHDGFAVFGYVVDGMDVVHAIHATETDPDKGEGFLKGQMLASPVKIVDMQRVEAP
ncbi:peptidylprolyl isomerase [Altererythrobacter sp. MF3-039]|uniref:peptidylprolyl isomerase n=1 Tax=Altererythrobacter sp. MF3-039 TaxID=3252901 RepID=UPI00390CA457